MSSAQPVTRDSDQYEDLALSDSSNTHKEGKTCLVHSSRPLTARKNHLVWLRALWSLFIHGVLAIFIAVFMLVYINNRNFNISERRPTVRLHDGSIVPWIFFAPLQSDITTILSGFIAVLRLVSAGWLGSLCWRCAFILMGEVGLKIEQLRHLISYNIATVPLHSMAKGKRATLWLIWVILIINIPVQLAAPVLTGSITWVPGHYAPKPLSNSVITTSQVDEASHVSWNSSTESYAWRREIARLAAGFVFLAWGRETKTDALRRFLPKLRLDIGSTLANITLPYFSVESIEWVKDPKAMLGTEQLDIENVICPRIAMIDPNVSSLCRPILNGAAFLIPDSPWPNQTDWRLSSSVVSEKRLMLKFVGRATRNSTSACEFYDPSLRLSSDNTSLDQALYIDPYNSACYIFAWVSYTAGAINCYNCPVSSYGTIQNHIDFPVQPSFLTEVTLWFMTDTAEVMTDMGAIDMAPTWENIDEDVVGTLTRSYAASWMALIESVGRSAPPHNTTYSISAPASRALVNPPRVYIWLGLQSLVTLSGVLFLCVQSRSGTPIIVDTTLAAFYLDTGAVPKCDGDHRAPTVRTVDFEGDRLRLKSE